MPATSIIDTVMLLEQLQSGKDAERAKAASVIYKEARKETNNERKSWLAEPHTLDILLNSLEDSNPKVVAELIGALGTIAWRYPNDTPIYSRIVEHITSKNKEAACNALIVLARLKAPRNQGQELNKKWEAILTLMKGKLSGKLLSAILQNIGRIENMDIPPHVIPLLEAQLLQIEKITMNTADKDAIHRARESIAAK